MDERRSRDAESGLPKGYSVSSLAFHRGTGLIIVSVTTREDRRLRYRVFARSLAERRYREVSQSGSDLSYKSLLVAAEAPLLFLNCFEANTLGDYWLQVLSVDLRTFATTPVIKRGAFAPSANATRIWVADLVAVDPLGTELACVVGQEIGREDETEARYDLCIITVSSAKLEVLTTLDNVFV